MGVWEIFKDKKNEFRFRLKARNGKVVLQSESYKTLQGAVKGIWSIKNNVFSKVILK